MSEFSYQAQGRNQMLRKRAKRCVCKYCGGRLRLKQLVFSEYDDARTEIFCRECDRIEFGVEQEIYKSAQYFFGESLRHKITINFPRTPSESEIKNNRAERR